MFPLSLILPLIVGDDFCSWVAAKADAESFAAALDCFEAAPQISLIELDIPWGEPGKHPRHFDKWPLEQCRRLISSLGTYFKARDTAIVVCVSLTLTLPQMYCPTDYLSELLEEVRVSWSFATEMVAIKQGSFALLWCTMSY
jgi:hypothetical protein